jgi:pimeloyl-ACP methyl ester carboxylesterase
MKRAGGIAALSLGLGGAAATAVVVRWERARRHSGPRVPGRHIRLSDASVYMTEAGEGPAVVFIHGFGGSLFSWRDVLALLAARHHVVALDLPGFGWSDRDARVPLGHRDHARRVVELMDYLDIGQATLVGHSMGGAIAQHVALEAPERVSGLVLVAPMDASAPVRRGHLRAQRRLFMAAVRAATVVRPAAFAAVRRALQAMVFDPASVDEGIVAGYAEPLMRPGTAACVMRMAADVSNELPAEVARIAAPTLVVSGERDGVIAMDRTAGLAAKIPGAAHEVLAGTGHLPPDEAPGRLAAIIEQFIDAQAGKRDATAANG